MNRYKYTLTVTPTATDRFMFYTLKDSSSYVFFYGKCFVLRNDTRVTIDVTDIINNYIYKGLGILTPTWSDTNIYNESGYQQPFTGGNYTGSCQLTAINGTDGEYHRDSVTLSLYSDATYSTLVTSLTKAQVYFHSIAPQDYKGGTNVGTGNYAFKYQFDYKLIPHLPKIATTNLAYGQLLEHSNSTQPYVSYYNSNNVQMATAAFSTSQPYNVMTMNVNALISGMSYPDNKMYVGTSGTTKVPCLVWDACPKPYYLLWLNPNGGLQSYGFEKTSTYTENYTVNKRLTYDDQSFKANETLLSKWKMKSGLVNADQYKTILQAARSQYCLLYITEYDRVFYVNVTDTKMEHKNRYNQKGKLFNAEFEVEACDSEFIII